MTYFTHVTVAAVIEQQGRFLIVEEKSKDHNYSVYNQPAGHVEYGENLIDACVRETLEETGYVIQVTDLIGIYTYTPAHSLDKTYYRFCFLAQAIDKISSQLDDNIIQTHWFTAHEIQKSPQIRSPLVTQAIQDYLAGNRFPLNIINESFLTPQPLEIFV